MTRQRLTRSRNKIIAGVCAGLAEYLGLDVSIVRIAFAVIAIFTAILPMCLVYLVTWFVVPQE